MQVFQKKNAVEPCWSVILLKSNSTMVIFLETSLIFRKSYFLEQYSGRKWILNNQSYQQKRRLPASIYLFKVIEIVLLSLLLNLNKFCTLL